MDNNKHPVMDILLTLPPPFSGYVKQHIREIPSVTGVYSDPEDRKLGSGGGTVNVLWLASGAPGIVKRIIIHSDGQSRRLPAYAPTGKSFIPVPVFKWGRGQRIDQSLLDLQLPLLMKILDRAPAGQNTLVVSGDALVWTDVFSEAVPVADVVCLGLWTRPEIASKHGVFVVPASDPTRLAYMLQKPGAGELQALTENAMYLLDAGIWLLSDKAVDFLFRETGWDVESRMFRQEVPDTYDLYTDFGSQLGSAPGKSTDLSVRIIPLDHAEFYHFGSNADLLQSTRKLHDRVLDQREIWHKKIKPTPEIFVQNAETGIQFDASHSSVWIENASVPRGWTLHHHHIITGVPDNDWHLHVPAGICLDFIPVGYRKWCIRPYGIHDTFKGRWPDNATCWMNKPATGWFHERGVTDADTVGFAGKDIYDCMLFPVLDESELDEKFIAWLLDPACAGSDLDAISFKSAWMACQRYSSHDIIIHANHTRLINQRKINLRRSVAALALNSRQSVFYQLDLDHLAALFRHNRLPLPPPPDITVGSMTRIHDLMFRAAYLGKQSHKGAQTMEKEAFAALREGMVGNLRAHLVNPVLEVYHDQILYARSPLRLDLAGGWTDTPPYCIIYGGKVVNMAVELNGQPPVQVFIRPTTRYEIVIHSIDLGVSEVIRTYDDIAGVSKVGSAFSIPRAALMLAGFYPGFSSQTYAELKEQLLAFGGGFDISLMVAVPKGSGLGTSSILAATLLGGLSDFCSLGWDRHETAYRTLLLEQLLTTGGGWQDQIGGIFKGVKLIESTPGLIQKPGISWMPDHLFTGADTKELMLLYYTGITRVAKGILADIVKGMFLNSSKHLATLSDMKYHALNTCDAIRHHDWNGLAEAVRGSWELNQRLDGGTNPPEVAAILEKIRDYTDSFKLLGAGGGGYLLIFAKDRDAAFHIRKTLKDQPPNQSARFVDWELSMRGLEVTKS